VLKSLSLQSRILVLVAAVTLVLMSVIVWFDSFILRKSVEETYVSQLDGITTSINGRYEESHSVQDVQQIFDYIQYKNKDVLMLTLYGKDEIIAATDRERIGRPSPPDLLERLERESTLIDHLSGEADGIPKDRLTAPLKEDGVTIGAIELLVDTSESAKLVRDRIWFIVAVGVTVAVLLLVILGFIIRQLLIRPLLSIREAAMSVREGGNYKPIALDAGQEINEVASAFNGMVEELESRYAELQRAQKKLLESEKMVALGSLVAGVSHEINTPIGVGVTAASYLDEKSADFRELFRDNRMKRSDLEEYLKTVGETTGMLRTNLHRASELIRSFKQVAVDRSAETKRTFLFKEYVQEVLISLQPRLKQTKHRVELTGQDGISVYNDPGAISQIVANLVLNSLTHAYEPGENGLIAIDVVSRKGEIVFLYSDDGKGMTPEVAEQIFNPFFTTNRGGGGTGLGMHIVYNLVTQSLGGTIRCDSRPGEGTRFILHLPKTTEGGQS